jgi:hypothetical protein
VLIEIDANCVNLDYSAVIFQTEVSE